MYAALTAFVYSYVVTYMACLARAVQYTDVGNCGYGFGWFWEVAFAMSIQLKETAKHPLP